MTKPKASKSGNNQYARWTDDEIYRLKKWYPLYLGPVLARKLKHPEGSVATMASHLGLKKGPYWSMRLRSQRKKPTRSWSIEEFKLLKKWSKHYTCQQIIGKLELAGFSRTRGSVKSYMRGKGLMISPEAIAKERKVPKPSWFQKGHTGVGAIRDVPLFSVVCRIHNRGYPEIFIKRENKKKARYNWILLSNYLWEAVHGPLKKGYMVAFKDGNNMNVTIQNLMCITQAENAVRNAGSKTLTDKFVATMMSRRGLKVDQQAKEEFLKHPDVIEMQRKIYQLQRQINKTSTK